VIIIVKMMIYSKTRVSFLLNYCSRKGKTTTGHDKSSLLRYSMFFFSGTDARFVKIKLLAYFVFKRSFMYLVNQIASFTHVGR